MKATALQIWVKKESGQRRHRDRVSYKQKRRWTISDLKNGEIRILEAKKNYRCCGFDCRKIIAKGTKHYSSFPKYQADSWFKACSFKCAVNAEVIHDSNDYVILKINSKHKLARNAEYPSKYVKTIAERNQRHRRKWE